MTSNIATTSAQSSRLLACGVSADTADMARYVDDSVPMMPWDWTTGSYGGTFPAWSLCALLGLMPKEIYDENSDSYYLSLAKEFPLSEEYGAAYIPCWDNGNAIVRKRDDNPIEACVQLIEWLTANNYKLNEI